jgi:hypothetical protein
MELAPGNYRVLAVGPDRSEASLDVELSADSDPVELTLATDPKHVQDFLQNGPRFERSEDAQ